MVSTKALLTIFSLSMLVGTTSYSQLRPLIPGGPGLGGQPIVTPTIPGIPPGLGGGGGGMKLQIESRLQSLEQRANHTEHNLQMALNKIDNLERLLSTINPVPPPPIHRPSVNCLLVDTGYKKTFLASGRNGLEAEVEVRRVCSQDVHSSYCNSTSSLKCDNRQTSSPWARGHICMLTDSGYGRSFKGEGSSAIIAEAKARIACQANVHSSYCGEVLVRCEEI